LLAVIGTGIWLFVDSLIKRSYTGRLKVLLQTILRYHLGLTLILYGLAKMFFTQFGSMTIDMAETKVGDFRGMSFLWTFMSYSKFFTFFSGFMEVVGGVLVLFRRTTFLGTFILFLAMATVVLLDIGYDVRVKMFAIHLFLMSILLMSGNLKRMARFFIWNKATEPYTFQPLFNTPKLKLVGAVLKTLLLLVIAYTFTMHQRDVRERVKKPYPEIQSLHKVDVFIKNGDTIPVGSTLSERWKTMRLNTNKYGPPLASIELSDDLKKVYSLEVDTVAKTFDFILRSDTTKTKHRLQYEELANKEFVFKGVFEGDTLSVTTKAKTLKDYKLTSRGIRWVTDIDDDWQ